MIRSILFDFGGTLDTDGIHWSEKFWDIYQRIGIPIEKPDFERAYLDAESKISHGVITKNCSLKDTFSAQIHFQIASLVKNDPQKKEVGLERFNDLIVRECLSDVGRTMLVTKGILKALKNNYSLGLVSNFYGNLETICRELDIASLFDTLIDSSIEKISKPDPAIFNIALSRLGAKAGECLMVGDSYDRDIVPSKSIGFVTAWLHGRSWKEPDQTDMADYRINSIIQLPPLLAKINQSEPLFL
jgi:FMN phosphatase YigB (HAD superfamily)